MAFMPLNDHYSGWYKAMNPGICKEDKYSLSKKKIAQLQENNERAETHKMSL